jgi:DNA-binding GntR family transcriptional regulator
MNASPTKLRDKAYDSFTERLLAREIKPGQFVSQRELVEITAMPLGAIRELIPRLEAEGLITTVPQRGMQVAHVDLSLIRNAYQFRLFLESQATALYSQTRSDGAIAALRASHEAIMRRAEQGETDTLITDAEMTDRSLHEAIIDHLDNEIISNAFRVNWIKIKLIRRNETRLYAELVIPVFRDHMKVIEAIEGRDADAAVAAMTAHINMSRSRAIDMN